MRFYVQKWISWVIGVKSNKKKCGKHKNTIKASFQWWKSEKMFSISFSRVFVETTEWFAVRDSRPLLWSCWDLFLRFKAPTELRLRGDWTWNNEKMLSSMKRVKKVQLNKPKKIEEEFGRLLLGYSAWKRQLCGKRTSDWISIFNMNFELTSLAQQSDSRQQFQ